jgi:uncharacterized protein YgiM (DUF1202 family)
VCFTESDEVFMFKLVSLLAAGLFLTLMVGGEDRGQTRQGLIGVSQNPVERPILREAAAPAPQPDVTLANFTPVKVKPVDLRKPVSVIAGPFEVTAPELPVAAAVVTPEAESDLPIMYVNSRSVNVRQGPSTNYDVVGRLARAEAVTVVSPEQDGWVQIRIEGDGVDGYIAARLLDAVDPASN